MNEALHRQEALAWLAGRLRWEQLLAELNRRVDPEDEPDERIAPPRAA